MFKKLLLSIFAIAVIFEEWLWDVLTAVGQWLSAVFHLAKFDAWLLAASPTKALFAFFIPVTLVTPFNLLALFLLAHGAILQGILLEIMVKLIGTLLIARVFRLTKTALLTFGWIAWLYTNITAILHWAHEIIRNTRIYQLSVKVKAEIKAKIAKMVKTIKLKFSL
jgi:hypothetical protein